MPSMTRRRFVATAAFGAVGLATGIGGWRAGQPGGGRLVIVGGGPAGVSAALAARSVDPRADILLLERDPTRLTRPEGPAPRFQPPAVANAFARLRHAGVQVALDEIDAVDWTNRRLTGFSGRRFAFDRIVLAPGVAPRAEEIDGLDTVARHHWPAAWGNAREARRLQAQLAALPDGGHVVIRLPDGPISHPVGPYHRVVEIAGFLARGKAGAHLSVLDAAADSEARRAFAAHVRSAPASDPIHGVDWRFGAGEGRVLAIDSKRGVLTTPAGSLRADVVNFIVAQRAGEIARRAGLVDVSGWCPCGPDGRSNIVPDAVVVGDAAASARRTASAARAAGTRAALSLTGAVVSPT
ncbi:MAG: FAD-dependent oxidoreductase [Rhodobacterales bacterium]|nr:FAD-dependent oxidoreductase [Rhodobacterales bacterium]